MQNPSSDFVIRRLILIAVKQWHLSLYEIENMPIKEFQKWWQVTLDIADEENHED